MDKSVQTQGEKAVDHVDPLLCAASLGTGPSKFHVDKVSEVLSYIARHPKSLTCPVPSGKDASQFIQYQGQSWPHCQKERLHFRWEHV